jgi:hypothetical protein
VDSRISLNEICLDPLSEGQRRRGLRPNAVSADAIALHIEKALSAYHAYISCIG